MSDPVIEVVVVETGDRAKAETPEAALVAAATLVREAREHGCGVRPTVRFLVDDVVVREHRGAINVPGSA